VPKCFGCKRSVPSDQLREFGENNRGWPEDELGCSHCRRRRLTHLVSVPEKEVTMSQKQPVVSIQIFPTDSDNYFIEGFIRIGGMKLEIDTDMNKVRDFFTRRKERKEAKLRTVESAN